MTITDIDPTLKAKQVIKDVARVLDIPLPEVKVLTDCIPKDDPKFTLKMALTPHSETDEKT